MRPIDANALLKHRRNFGKDYALDPVDKNIDDQLVDLRHVLNAPTLDYAPVVHGEWVLTESPYAEHEEAFDGESHDRWTCSLCGGEAGFECDPDGFAGFQEKTKFCGHCGALMDGGKKDG